MPRKSEAFKALAKLIQLRVKTFNFFKTAFVVKRGGALKPKASATQFSTDKKMPRKARHLKR